MLLTVLYQVGTSPHKLMLCVMLMRASRSRTHTTYTRTGTRPTLRSPVFSKHHTPHGRGSKRRRGPRAWWCLRLCLHRETPRARPHAREPNQNVRTRVSVQDGTQQCARLLVRTGTEWRRNDARPSEWPQSFSRVSHVHRGEALASLASALALGAAPGAAPRTPGGGTQRLAPCPGSLEMNAGISQPSPAP